MSAEQSNLCDDIQPWLAAYALGDAEEGAAAQAHLAVCLRCQHDLREYRLVAGMLPFSVPEAMPQPELREQVIAAVKRQVAESISAPLPAQLAVPSTRARNLGRRRSFWAVLAFAALALVLVGWNISLQRELDSQTAIVAQSRQNWQTMIVLLDDAELAKYAVTADPAPAPGEYPAHGRFWASPQVSVACLVLQGLPDLPADQVYQVWLVRGNQQVSGGTFQARNGKAWAFVHPREPITGYSEMFVTVEPSGGNTWPGGPRVVSSMLAGAATAGGLERQELLGLLRDQARRED
jgi:Anti-sigma-K factor rskA